MSRFHARPIIQTPTFFKIHKVKFKTIIKLCNLADIGQFQQKIRLKNKTPLITKYPCTVHNTSKWFKPLIKYMTQINLKKPDLKLRNRTIKKMILSIKYKEE